MTVQVSGGVMISGDRYPSSQTTADELMKHVKVTVVKRPIKTGQNITASGPMIPVSQEVMDDTRVMQQLMTDMMTPRDTFLDYDGPLNNDHVALLAWQAANTITTLTRRLAEANETIERQRETARAMFGNTDPYAVAELLGIPTEC